MFDFRLTQKNYEENLHEILTSDEVVYLDTSLHPCNKNFIPKNFTVRSFVFF